MGIWVGWKAQLSYQEFIFLLTYMESSGKKIIHIANILVYLASVLSVCPPPGGWVGWGGCWLQMQEI